MFGFWGSSTAGGGARGVGHSLLRCRDRQPHAPSYELMGTYCDPSSPWSRRPGTAGTVRTLPPLPPLPPLRPLPPLPPPSPPSHTPPATPTRNSSQRPTLLDAPDPLATPDGCHATPRRVSPAVTTLSPAGSPRDTAPVVSVTAPPAAVTKAPGCDALAAPLPAEPLVDIVDLVSPPGSPSNRREIELESVGVVQVNGPLSTNGNRMPGSQSAPVIQNPIFGSTKNTKSQRKKKYWRMLKEFKRTKAGRKSLGPKQLNLNGNGVPVSSPSSPAVGSNKKTKSVGAHANGPSKTSAKRMIDVWDPYFRDFDDPRGRDSAADKRLKFVYAPARPHPLDARPPQTPAANLLHSAVAHPPPTPPLPPTLPVSPNGPAVPSGNDDSPDSADAAAYVCSSRVASNLAQVQPAPATAPAPLLVDLTSPPARGDADVFVFTAGATPAAAAPASAAPTGAGTAAAAPAAPLKKRAAEDEPSDLNNNLAEEEAEAAAEAAAEPEDGVQQPSKRARREVQDVPLDEAVQRLLGCGARLLYRTPKNKQSADWTPWTLRPPPPPEPWSDVLQYHQLRPDSSEFQAVSCAFAESSRNQGFRVTRVCRVENTALLKLFQEQVADLENKCEDVAVLRMYHGTRRDSIHSICRRNLDLNRAGIGSNHTWWGHGVNFSPISYYSSHYCDQVTTRSMLVFDVLVGRVFSRQHIGKQLPPLPEDPQRCYDTNMKLKPAPQVLVKFSEHSFYPCYVIDFEAPPAGHRAKRVRGAPTDYYKAPQPQLWWPWWGAAPSRWTPECPAAFNFSNDVNLSDFKFGGSFDNVSNNDDFKFGGSFNNVPNNDAFRFEGSNNTNVNNNDVFRFGGSFNMNVRKNDGFKFGGSVNNNVHNNDAFRFEGSHNNNVNNNDVFRFGGSFNMNVNNNDAIRFGGSHNNNFNNNDVFRFGGSFNMNVNNNDAIRFGGSNNTNVNNNYGFGPGGSLKNNVNYSDDLRFGGSFDNVDNNAYKYGGSFNHSNDNNENVYYW